MIRLSSRLLKHSRHERAWWKRIKIHPLFVALLVISLFAGLGFELFLLFFIVILHEMGHAMVAEYLGYEVESISLMPFGGVARLSYGNIGFRPKHETLIAIAGPFVNLLLCVLVWIMFLFGLCSLDFVHAVIGLNAWIALFNLLPALPLDGGRIYRAALSRRVGFDKATREAYRMAIMISLVLLIVGAVALWAGSPHVGMVILGLFLLFAAWSGRRDISMEVVRFLDIKKRAGTRQPVPVKSIVTPTDSTVREVVRQFSPEHYHMVYVLDQDGNVRTVLEEDELLEAVFEGRWLQTVGEWIDTP